MNEQIQQTREVTNDGTATKTTRVIDDNMSQTQPETVNKTNTAARLVMFVAGVLLTLLAFRFVLVLLGANQNNGFANFIYTVSHPFAAPFFGLFGYSLRYGVSRFELSTLIAMAVYALVAYGIARLLTIRQK